MDFFIANVNAMFHTAWDPLGLVLPIGISFYTFTQIAYLVDAYQGEVRENSLLNYSLFVSFFPQLIAGPILHHREMMPQFVDPANRRVNSRNIALGITIFVAGLVKKVVIADTLAPIANYGFDEATALTLAEGWMTSLAYTFQLYFDFSGYTDMAIGAALLFNIKLPFNFDSPYKSLNIQVFWRRWHMTLGRFLMRYVYIPLGGNRRGRMRTYINLIATFLIGGFWHGAGWTFIFWGLLHGMALVIHRIWQTLNIQMPRLLAWLLTFLFVNASWVFFRAKEWEDALKVLRGMVNFESIGIRSIDLSSAVLIAAVFLLAICFRNTNQWQERFRPNLALAGAVAAGAVYALIQMNKISEFLYFNF
jgi:D-alanyl-lipoteichoic acid acyltransferase DltB (MBOAT superfamily)